MNYKEKTLNELFAYEVAQIDDDKIKNFVIDTLNEVNPEQSWTSASSTGKYHPEFANGEGGLVRHTKVVVKNIMELIDAVPNVENEKDELIAAAIIHDMWKYPKGNESEYTAFDHPMLAAEYCKEKGFDTIARLVAAHQGIHNKSTYIPNFENETPKKFDEWLLHIADMFASRIYLKCDFDENGELITTKKPSRKIAK